MLYTLTWSWVVSKVYCLCSQICVLYNNNYYFGNHYNGIARWHKHYTSSFPCFPKGSNTLKGVRDRIVSYFIFFVTFTQTFCLKYAVSLLTQEGEPNGSLVCDLSLRSQKAHTMSSSLECTNDILTLHLSTKSLSAMISTERGSWPAGAFSGIS